MYLVTLSHSSERVIAILEDTELKERINLILDDMPLADWEFLIHDALFDIAVEIEVHLPDKRRRLSRDKIEELLQEFSSYKLPSFFCTFRPDYASEWMGITGWRGHATVMCEVYDAVAGISPRVEALCRKIHDIACLAGRPSFSGPVTSRVADEASAEDSLLTEKQGTCGSWEEAADFVRDYLHGQPPERVFWVGPNPL